MHFVQNGKKYSNKKPENKNKNIKCYFHKVQNCFMLLYCTTIICVFNNSYLEVTRWHYYSEYVFSFFLIFIVLPFRSKLFIFIFIKICVFILFIITIINIATIFTFAKLGAWNPQKYTTTITSMTYFAF